MSTPNAPATIDDLRTAYRVAAVNAERADATVADHAAWLAAQQAYYAAGGSDPVQGYPPAVLLAGSYYWIDPTNGIMTALADDGTIDPESVTAVDLDAVDDDLRAQIEEALK